MHPSATTWKMEHIELQNRKSPLPKEQKVSDASAVVDDAARWSGALWNKEYVGIGDTQEAAMYRASARHGIEPNVFWALRYRRPKDVLASVYFKLKAAYENECERQEARLRHELEMVKALERTPGRQALVDAAEAALGTAEGKAT